MERRAVVSPRTWDERQLRLEKRKRGGRFSIGDKFPLLLTPAAFQPASRGETTETTGARKIGVGKSIGKSRAGKITRGNSRSTKSTGKTWLTWVRKYRGCGGRRRLDAKSIGKIPTEVSLSFAVKETSSNDVRRFKELSGGKSCGS